jgi:hypothetical protein
MQKTVSLPPDLAAEMKFCSPQDIDEALAQGFLTPKTNSTTGVVAWDERFDRWNADLTSTQLRDYVNSIRYTSKTMWPGERWQVAKVAQGFQRTWKGSRAVVVPVNLTNFELLVRAQDGYHDGNVCTPETMDEIKADLIEGDGIGVYQILIWISHQTYRHGMMPSSACMTVFDAAIDLGIGSEAVRQLMAEHRLTFARYHSHIVIYRDRQYARVKREMLEQRISGDGATTTGSPSLGLHGARLQDSG